MPEHKDRDLLETPFAITQERVRSGSTEKFKDQGTQEGPTLPHKEGVPLLETKVVTKQQGANS
jgi:hypothetical protein